MLSAFHLAADSYIAWIVIRGQLEWGCKTDASCMDFHTGLPIPRKYCSDNNIKMKDELHKKRVWKVYKDCLKKKA